MTLSQAPASPRVMLVALTPEAKAALGADKVDIRQFPFRVVRELRAAQRFAPHTIADRRKPARSSNHIYLREPTEPFNVSREHFQIDYNGTRFILTDRQTACGTLVEGCVIGGRNTGGRRRAPRR